MTPGRTLPLLQSPGVEIRAAAANRQPGTTQAIVRRRSAERAPSRSPCSTLRPAGFAVCGGAVDWSPEASLPGTVVVVVLVAAVVGTVVVVVEVVVGSTVDSLTVVVVVVVDVVGTDVVGSLAGVVVVVVLVVVAQSVSRRSGRVRRRSGERGGGARPAFCSVVTSATRRTSDLFSVALSDVRAETACCRPFCVASRWFFAALAAAPLAADAVSKSDPTIRAYWLASTP